MARGAMTCGGSDSRLTRPHARPAQVLDIKELEDDDLFDALRMEIMILRQLKHP